MNIQQQQKVKNKITKTMRKITIMVIWLNTTTHLTRQPGNQHAK